MNALVKIIAPIIVVLASIGSLFFVNQLKTTKIEQREKIAGLERNLDTTKNRLATTETDLGNTKRELQTSQGQTAAAEAKVTDLTTQLTAKTSELDTKLKELDEVKTAAATKEREAQEAKAELGKVREEFAKVKDEAEKNATALANVKELETKLAAVTTEHKTVTDKLAVAEEQVKQLKIEKEQLTVTPVTARGRVMAVQPNWGFFVLDIGDNQKVRQNSEFLVVRDAKLVGRAKIVSVSESASIAELLPPYERAIIRVGDQVTR